MPYRRFISLKISQAMLGWAIARSFFSPIRPVGFLDTFVEFVRFQELLFPVRTSPTPSNLIHSQVESISNKALSPSPLQQPQVLPIKAPHPSPGQVLNKPRSACPRPSPRRALAALVVAVKVKALEAHSRGRRWVT